MTDAPDAVTFTTTVLSAGGTKAGIEVPDEVLDALGGGRRVPVLVTVGRHTWASTTAVMGGRTLLGMSTENRRRAGIEVGQQVEVGLAREQGPREVAVPDDLAAALAGAGLREAFDALAPGYRKNHVVQVEGAKAEATRARRVQKVLDSLPAEPARGDRRGRGPTPGHAGAPVTTRVAGAPSGVRQTRVRRPATAR